MGKDRRRLEQNRARKKARMAARKKQRQAQGNSEIGSFFSRFGCTRGQVGKGDLYGAWADDRLFEAGLGYVIVARRLSAGRVAAGVFLVDVYCLGVKDAFLSVTTELEFHDRLLARMSELRNMADVTPTYARKLIEGAIAYARGLGFEPAEDYEDAELVMGTINPADCTETFCFGKDGKPFFVNGPQISEAQAESIVQHLTNRFGPDGFHYLIGPDELDEDHPDRELMVDMDEEDDGGKGRG